MVTTNMVWIARRREGMYDSELRLRMPLAPLFITPLDLSLYGVSIGHVSSRKPNETD